MFIPGATSILESRVTQKSPACSYISHKLCKSVGIASVILKIRNTQQKKCIKWGQVVPALFQNFCSMHISTCQS